MAIVVLIVAGVLFFWFRSIGSELNKFRSKTLGVVRRDFAYNPGIPGVHKEVFDSITRQILLKHGNEFDAAIAFMLVQCGALVAPLSPEASRFVDEKLAAARNVEAKSVFGEHLLLEFAEHDPRGKA